MKVFLLVFVAVFATTKAVSVINCDNVKCAPDKAEDCLKSGKAFVQMDGLRHCCDSCVDVKDVVEPIACIPEMCMKQPGMKEPKCQDMKKCQPDEALVPKGPCRCCDSCVKIKSPHHCRPRPRPLPAPMPLPAPIPSPAPRPLPAPRPQILPMPIDQPQVLPIRGTRPEPTPAPTPQTLPAKAP